MQRNNQEFLATEPIGKLLIKLAIPTVTAQIVNMLYNLVDRIYIGNMEGVGALALTGLGVCAPIILLISAFAALVSAGGAPIASISMGAGDNKKANRILGSCFSLLVLISIVLCAVVLLWNEEFLMLFGASSNTIKYATDYMGIYAVGTIFVQITLGMNAFITAQGYAKTSMLTVVIGAVINIILDPIFIFGLNMGVKGAALATVISQGVSCAWVIFFLCGDKTTLRLSKEVLGFDWKILRNAIALGSSSFIMQASESILFICFNSSLLLYGGDIAVGAMTILMSIMQFAMLPLQGMAQGAQPITSYNYGAKNSERVKQIFFLLIKWSLVFSTFLWAMLMLFPNLFANAFTNDANLVDFTAKAIRVYFMAQCLFGAQIACQMTFVAIGYAKSSILVAVMRKFILLIPLIYIVPQFMADKTTAVYLAEPIADTISVAFCVTLFSIQFKKALKKMETKTN